jgi:tRNA pseudouridine38-40 synthase
MRYAFRISYDGTGFYGWQSQKTSENTIQFNIESKLSQLFNTSIEVIGCGRTDSGVHARDYVFHFDGDKKFESEDLRYKFNFMVDNRIFCHEVKLVDDTFHSRFDAKSRSYIYRVKQGRDPFNNRFGWEYVYNDELDLNRLNEAAEVLLSYKDFNTFCKTKTDVRTTICEVTQSEWIFNESDEMFEYHVTSDRFLRGMIRLIVGACFNYNRGKLTLESIKDALDNKARLKTDWGVPPEGLMLHKIIY